MTGPVAILGASGFIGSRAVEMLHLGGIPVRPVVRRRAALASAARFALQGAVADGFDRRALRRAFAGCSAVVHCVAGDARTILGTLEPAYAAAEEAGVRRLIYLSSASVHCQSPLPGTDESSPLSARQKIPYNNAKVRAERRLLELRSRGSVELVMLRPGIVFGPRSWWIAGFAEELLAGRAYLVGGGRGICNSAYVDNVVDAVRLALEAKCADGEAYIIGDAEEVTWREFYRPIAEALGFNVEALAEPDPALARLSFSERLHRFRSTRLPRLHLRRPLRRLAAAVSSALGLPTPEAPASHSGGGQPPPRPTEERALLHTCSYKLPWLKARMEFGYEPRVSLAEGCRRSIAWLAFAGYPILENVQRNEAAATRSPDTGRDGQSVGTERAGVA